MSHTRYLYPALVALVASSAAVAGSPVHTTFKQSLGNEIVRTLAGTRWSSACFAADNGLHARMSASIDKPGVLELKTSYFFDIACSSSAGMATRVTGNLVQSGQDPAAFRVVGVRDVQVLRNNGLLVVSRDTETVSLGQEVEK